MSDMITLTIPAKSDYLLTVRLAASTIGSRIGFDINDIEDIKTATAEACLIIMHEDKSNNIKIEFDVDNKSIKVRVKGFGIKQTIEGKGKNDTSLGQYLLEALSDKVEFDRKKDSIQSVTFSKNMMVR